jgi:hypothetical protein
LRQYKPDENSIENQLGESIPIKRPEPTAFNSAFNKVGTAVFGDGSKLKKLDDALAAKSKNK